jgi:hypothetical protein
MQIFRIEEIVPAPIDVVAEDRDHAARIFVTAMPGTPSGSRPQAKIVRAVAVRRWLIFADRAG